MACEQKGKASMQASLQLDNEVISGALVAVPSIDGGVQRCLNGIGKALPLPQVALPAVKVVVDLVPTMKVVPGPVTNQGGHFLQLLHPQTPLLLVRSILCFKGNPRQTGEQSVALFWVDHLAK